MRHRHLLDRERGSVSILTAGVMVVAAVLSLVAVDLMRVIQAKERAQTAADAAALAAAQELAIPSGAVPTDEAREYALRNGATLTRCGCQAGSAEAVVEVGLVVRFVLLGGDRTLHASARAVVEGRGG